jgi:shikimate kinase
LNKPSAKAVSAQVRLRVRTPSALKNGTESTLPAVFLVGFMGAGKTSVGKALGERVNWVFEDLDDRIERRERRTVAQIFRESGEPAFRRAEHSALQDVLDGIHEQPSVIAMGGGAYVQTKNADLLKASGVPIIFLDAPVEELWERCCKQASAAAIERPLLRSLEQFRELYETRRRHYAEGSITIQTGRRAVAEIAAEIEEKLKLNKIDRHAKKGEVE